VTGIVMVLLSAKMSKERPYTNVCRFLGGILFLTLTWIVLFWLMVALTARGAPWAQSFIPPPPKGTWQRQLNDFLATHELAPAVVTMSISVVIFVAGVLRAANNHVRSRLPFALGVVNLGFVLLDLLAIWLADYLTDLWLPPPRTDADVVGYHRFGLSLVVTGVLLGLLFWSQIKVISSPFWERNWSK
jgi:TM2 domain-containing membrane protein YozV